MNKTIHPEFKYLLIGLFFLLTPFLSKAYIPTPDHVVVVVLENHAYQEIVGSSSAPYINGLLSDQQCALFTQSYGLSHPSQPNYFQLFSGSNQGITDNNIPDILPMTSLNLGASLIAAGRTFTGYSEDLPAVGANDSIYALYARKHNPWVNWQGAPVNGIPASSNQPYTSFPVNFSLLPTVSFVVPNLANDMHNGSDPSRISTGDTWIQNNLDAYVQWAKSHNSLLVLTFDEDDDLSGQHILTLIIGQHVKAGAYSNTINHYNVLRMLEDMYSLPHAGSASSASPIDFCWNLCASDPIITAGGFLTICPGNNVTLTASSGLSYLWSTGATTNSISVNTSGNYSVTVTDSSACIATSPAVTVSVSTFSSTAIVFTESMGTVGGTTAISTHEAANGFDNDIYNMTGTADIRNTTASSGYSGASGLANVFITSTVGKNFIISGINTSGMSGLELSFGIFKSTLASTGSDLQVLVSADGVNYSALSFALLPTTSANWSYRTAVGSIPAVPNLSIQFRQNGTAAQYRIDDVKLTYQVSYPVITAAGPTSFCQGGSVILSSTLAPGYTWSNGSSSSSITVSTSGNYSVSIAGGNGCSATSNVIPVTVYSSPAIAGFSPSSGLPGSTVVVTGTHFTGTTSITLSGNACSFTVISDSEIQFIVPGISGVGNITVVNPCGNSTSVTSYTVSSSTTLQLRVFIQGYYLGSGQMNMAVSPGVCDTLFVDLHSESAPYQILVTDTGTINASGYVSFTFPGSYAGSNYFLGIRHRNSIETWSASAVHFNTTASTYDFTTSVSQAYGGNQALFSDGNAGLFSGDITQNGVIDDLDLSLVENASQQFDFGYLSEDLTGDLLVDAEDYSLIENNSQLLITIQRP